MSDQQEQRRREPTEDALGEDFVESDSVNPRDSANLSDSDSSGGDPTSTHTYRDLAKRKKRKDDSVGTRPRQFHPVLICLSGNQRGERRSVRAREMVLGRGTRSDWQIADGAASRSHVLIEYENIDTPEEFPVCYAKDLGSRNGTQINGRDLDDRVRLNERDRLLIGSTMVGFFIRDDAEFKHDESLYISATSDPLTRLDNRRQLRLHMRHHVARARRKDAPLCFLLLDLDHFKTINDRYGHDVGDTVLVHIAGILRGTCREQDLIARWGGEEFALCLPDTKLDEAQVLGERLRKRIEETPLVSESLTISLTTSIGGTCFLEGDDEDTVFQRADQMLYRAKRTGRNRCCYTDRPVSQTEEDESEPSGGRD